MNISQVFFWDRKGQDRFLGVPKNSQQTKKPTSLTLIPQKKQKTLAMSITARRDSAIRGTKPPSAHIRWAHAVNSMQALGDSLRLDFEGKPVFDALEADLSWNTVHSRAIMKHAKWSDSKELECTAEEWLDLAMGKQLDVHIVKLDFKSLKAVRPVVEYCAKIKTEHSPHVFLNADVLVGPGMTNDAAAPIDVLEFIKACEALPDATLSLGWTTSWSPFDSVKYEHDHVDEMIKILNEYTSERHVTFPMRASMVKDSWPAVSKLLNHNTNSSLTLWTALEGVPEEEIQWILKEVNDHERVYVDCDKGPKHARGDPVRFFHYVYHGIIYKLSGG